MLPKLLGTSKRNIERSLVGVVSQKVSWREKLKVKEHVEKVILDRTRMKYDFSFAFKAMN